MFLAAKGVVLVGMNLIDLAAIAAAVVATVSSSAAAAVAGVPARFLLRPVAALAIAFWRCLAL